MSPPSVFYWGLTCSLIFFVGGLVVFFLSITSYFLLICLVSIKCGKFLDALAQLDPNV